MNHIISNERLTLERLKAIIDNNEKLVLSEASEGATFAIKRAMEAEPKLKVTLPNLVEDKILENLF